MPDKYVISTSQAKRQMPAIKTSKASDPDDTANWIMKEFAECLSGSVCAFFDSSLRQGHVPQMWKSAVVCPLAKVPSPSVIEKHLRPISLTVTKATSTPCPHLVKGLRMLRGGMGNGHHQGRY